MNSGQYDKDCTTWNPQGDITQLKHAAEAVKQGTAVVALRTKKFAVLGAIKKRSGAAGAAGSGAKAAASDDAKDGDAASGEGSSGSFASFDKKLFKIDDHCGIGISGLTADARVLADYMRTECLENKYVYEEPKNVGRLVAEIGHKAAERTLVAGKRPYGVGLLVASVCKKTGPHVYHVMPPTGDYYEYTAMSMGRQSQSAKTYLEKNYESFRDDESSDEKAILKHCFKALYVTSSLSGGGSSSSGNDGSSGGLNLENCDVGIVGVGEGQEWRLLSDSEKQAFIDECRAEAPAPAGSGADDGGAAPMEE